MSGDWKPGDVALVDSWRGEGQLAFRTERIQGEPNWCVLDGTDTRGLHDREIATARPVVVIDPEDAEQLERLWRLFVVVDTRSDLTAALREFATPTPPRPDEPRGLGAVVEDAEGRRWTNTHGVLAWVRQDGSPRKYADVAAVRVLSDGITTDLGG